MSALLLSLLSLLQARRDWPGPLLAERLEISPRTVRRDVDRLRELGYPIQATKGPDGGYLLDAGTELPPLLFDDEQAVALTVALRTATATGAGIAEAATRALSTVRQVMPARLRHRIDALHVTAVERPGTRANPQVDIQVLVSLGDAVRTREVLRFDYAAAPGAGPGHESPAPPRRVQPHYLITWGGYARDGVVEALGADRCRLVLGSWSWPGLAAIVGSFDTDIEVVGPPRSHMPSPGWPAATPMLRADRAAGRGVGRAAQAASPS